MITQLFESKLLSYQINHTSTLLQEYYYPQRKRMNREEEIFEVEAILDYRVNEGREEFRVKWKGFSMKDCTWEPTVNLEGCFDVVKEFKIRRGIWFKREPYKEPPKPEKEGSSESSAEEEGQLKSVAQSAASNADEEGLLDKYKANTDQEAAPPIIPINQDECYLPQKVDNSKQTSDRMKKPSMTLLRMLKNKEDEIFFRVQSEGQIKVIPRSQIYKQDITLLLQFYEQYLEISRQKPSTYH